MIKRTHLRGGVNNGREREPKSNDKARRICKEDEPVLDDGPIDCLATGLSQYADVWDGVQLLKTIDWSLSGIWTETAISLCAGPDVAVLVVHVKHVLSRNPPQAVSLFSLVEQPLTSSRTPGTLARSR